MRIPLIPLSVDIVKLSSVYVVYHAYENSNPIIFINFSSWILFFSNGLSHYGGVICFVHITIQKNCELLRYSPLRIDIIYYLISIWHFSSSKFNLLKCFYLLIFWILFVREFLIRFSSNVLFYILKTVSFKLL